MAEPFGIEQEYGRFIPPQIEKEVKKAHEEAEFEFNSVEETDDGGAIVTIAEEIHEETEFYQNLAEGYIAPRILESTATTLLDLIEKDKQAREKRDEQYKEGIQRTGMGNDAPGGASFEGASKIVHPVMAESCVDFAARAMKELFPPQGPVRTKIVGKVTKEELEKADRKRDYMNWQLTGQIRNYRAELEQLLTQLPLGGGQYLKIWYDDVRKRPDCEFVPIDDIYLPYACSNFYSSPRTTHAQDITKLEFEKRIRTGLYRKVQVSDTSVEPEPTAAQEATDKVEGKEATAYNEDGLRRVYEIYALLSFEDDEHTNGDTAPYIITIDEDSKDVLALYRNWEEGDVTFTALDWIVEFAFIPWRGAYPIGLPQLIGGLSAALTGALRALLDTAHINNFPALLKLKGAGKSMGGQSKSIEPTEMSEIEGPVGADDVRKIVMPMPFNPPSPVLFQMLDWLTNQARNVVGTASETIADATNSMPVGTALALIEQGSITYASIHARLHAAQARALEIIARLNRMYLEEESQVKELGEVIIRRKDFEGSMNVIPVSDPNIFSEAQRYAQVQAILQLETVSEPGTFNKYAVRRRALSLMHVDDIDEILPPPPSPKELNAVAENVALTYAQPLAVFPEQDHLAHIETHLEFVTDPNLGGNPLNSNILLPMMDHIKQHMSMYYSEACDNAMKEAGLEQGHKDIREQDNAIALASKLASEAVDAMFQNFKEPFANAMKAVQSAQEAAKNDIQDPSAKAMLQAALAETNRKAEADKQKASNDAQAMQSDTQKALQEAQIKASKVESDSQAKLQDAQLKVMKIQQDAQDKMNDLQKQLMELQHKDTVEATKARNAEATLNLKAQEAELKHQLNMAQLAATAAELNRKIWEYENKHQLEEEKLDLQAYQIDVQSVLAAKAEQNKAEASEKQEAEKESAPDVSSQINEIKSALADLAKKVNKPRKVTVTRDKKGKVLSLESGE